MSPRTIGAVVNAIVMAGYALVATWNGYHRRRAHWTAGSWIGLTIVVLVGLSLLAFSFVITGAVDNHEAWVGAPRSSARSGWTMVTMASGTAGVLLAAVSLAWFALGEPTQQFPLLGSHRGARGTPSAPDRQRSR